MIYDTLLEIHQSRLDSDEIPEKGKSSLRVLREFDSKELFDVIIPVVYLYTRGKKDQPIFCTEMICAIGRATLFNFGKKKDSALAARIGAFILYTFELGGILELQLVPGMGKHAAYAVIIKDDNAIRMLWESIEVKNIEKLPSEVPYEPYFTSEHETGHKLVKTHDRSVLDNLNPVSHPIVFSAINKAMKTGWRVNKRVFDVALWALRNKTDAFSDIWEQQNPEAKKTKLRESRTILDIAFRFLDKDFYHLYYFDFRGRIYTTSAFFNHQGSDLSKGLILRKDKAPITKEGLDWLYISLANNYAGGCGREDGAKTDKIPLKDRIQWGKENEALFIAFADDPKTHQGWMKADAPWQFLAACHELRQFRKWQKTHATEIKKGIVGEYDYETSLEVFIDGSCNGSQHLSALTRDDITAPYVNLVSQDMPGDLYTYAAKFVWEHISNEISKYSEKEIADLEMFIDKIAALRQDYISAKQGSELKKTTWAIYSEFKKKHANEIERASIVYWNRFKDNKERRKLLKRGVMTLSYGVTRYGLGTQIVDDAKKHGIEKLYYMEHKWAIHLGQMIYDVLKTAMKRPMQLLHLFEKAGDDADKVEEFLHWNVPITKFPVVQHYTEGTTKQCWVQYGPPKGEKQSTGFYENTLRLNVNFHELLKKSKGKQKSGASPNCIHSLDAAHLMLTIHKADFTITTIHDSYGCLLPDMPKLFPLVRETFVELYMSNPLEELLNQIGADISGVEIGSLDITEILKSEYAFA